MICRLLNYWFLEVVLVSLFGDPTWEDLPMVAQSEHPFGTKGLREGRVSTQKHTSFLRWVFFGVVVLRTLDLAVGALLFFWGKGKLGWWYGIFFPPSSVTFCRFWGFTTGSCGFVERFGGLCGGWGHPKQIKGFFPPQPKGGDNFPGISFSSLELATQLVDMCYGLVAKWWSFHTCSAGLGVGGCFFGGLDTCCDLFWLVMVVISRL